MTVGETQTNHAGTASTADIQDSRDSTDGNIASAQRRRNSPVSQCDYESKCVTDCRFIGVSERHTYKGDRTNCVVSVCLSQRQSQWRPIRS